MAVRTVTENEVHLPLGTGHHLFFARSTVGDDVWRNPSGGNTGCAAMTVHISSSQLKMPRHPQRGFTVVELLVVLAVISMLVSILLPTLDGVRETARRSRCSNNLKQLGVALHSYHDHHGTFPFGWMVTRDFNVQGWGVQILPFLEQSTVVGHYDSRVPPFNEANLLPPPFAHFDPGIARQNIQLINTVLDVFVCPTAGDGYQRKYRASVPAGFYGPGIPPITLSWSAAPADYSPVTGVRMEFAAIAFADMIPIERRYGAIQPAGIIENRPSRISDITDGLSNTILLGERVGGPDIFSGWYPVTPTPDNDVNGGGWGDFLNGDHWLKGSEHDGTRTGSCAINCTSKRSSGFLSLHPAGCQFLLCDGSVRFVLEAVQPRVLASAVTRAGRETSGWEE